MALPASDTFTAANGTALQTYSASWTINQGAFSINTNAAYCDSGLDSLGRWNADVFPNDQYSQVTPAALSASNAIGVAVRIATSGAASGYGWYGNSVDSEIFKLVAGIFTTLGSARPALTVSNIIRLEVTGTTITAKNGGVQQGTTQTDSSLTAGSAGLAGWTSNTGNRIDNWEGGSVSAATTSFPPVYPYRSFIHMLVR